MSQNHLSSFSPALAPGASVFPSRFARVFAIALIFTMALAVRLYDLTDLPLDFHPTRQLLSAIKARGLYYETQPDGIPTWKLETAIRQAKLKADVEPVVFERVVAFTYRFTGEQLWIARIYSSLFWLIGGIFLFMLVRELISFEGAIFSAVYYLFFPYSIIASRSFQPDPLMVMLVLAFWWMFSRWITLTPGPSPIGRGVKAAILAGLLGGLAIFIKFSAAFFVIGAALGLGLSRFTLRELSRNTQVWLMAFLGILPAAAYLVYGIFIGGYLGGQFSGRFIPALLLSPVNYLQWATKADLAAGGLFSMLGLLGLFLVNNKQLRSFMIGLWIAYLSYGLFFNYHVATHDYYHLPLIPIVALSLSPFGDWFFARLTEASPSPWVRSAVYFILLFGLFSVLWSVRNQMKAVDYRPEALMWAEVGEQLADERVVALTQDYGSRLEYWGLKTAATWPYVGDINYIDARGGSFSFDELFNEYSSKRDFFLITDFDELDRQLELKSRLFASYLIHAQGDGYIIFDLRSPMSGGHSGS
ncbi:MAG: glycosyltransferase family 39 protein [Anaerolineae bacterium]|nr:glycosyltransferase family 39 protein [Anaerolineae bacterium]MCI0607915.1 glycosyltransferase family 39 protein [Anaerolineae bacterium]